MSAAVGQRTMAVRRPTAANTGLMAFCALGIKHSVKDCWGYLLHNLTVESKAKWVEKIKCCAAPVTSVSPAWEIILFVPL